MQKISAALNHNKIYFGGLLTFLFAGILCMILNGNETTFISLNSYHAFYLNIFFINYTFMGDGIFALCLIALMFFYLKRNQCSLALLYSFLISGVAVQIIKNLVNSTRPNLYFEAGSYLNIIDDVTLSGSSSFPSGHTTTAFAIATVIILMMKNKNGQLLILMAAVLVGYSRIYLAQHFLQDVIIGALLGTASGILSFYLVQNRITIKRSMKHIYRVPSGSVSSPSTMQTA